MSEFEAVLEESEVQDGAMRAVEADGVPLLVSRSEGGKVCAIANTCTHMGGPLNEGEHEGNVVTCPGTVLSSTCAQVRSYGDLPESQSSASRPGCVKGR